MTLGDLTELGHQSRNWLFDHAFDLWATAGYDEVHGGFFDKLDMSGAAADLPKRTRVQARQIFVFAEAGRLGWSGPWRERVEGALAFLFDRFQRPDGLFRVSVNREGAPVTEMPDLYDQAFVIFALAAVQGLDIRFDARAAAIALLTRLRDEYAHPKGGFREIDEAAPVLRSNPHMHMLEAVLAWCEHERGTLFEDVAREIIVLARTRFLDPGTGAVGEYYDNDWNFAPAPDGRLREPGHQFEWAYLFDLGRIVLGEDSVSQSAQLLAFGERHGLYDRRPVFALDADGVIRDKSTRLWAITEWLRAATLLRTANEAESASINDAFGWLMRFLDVPTKGLWRERIGEDGRWIDEPVPASSLYHILTGVSPLLQLATSRAIS